jgi:2,4-didehydro-3-deoxy-L-rhamnonate hydrolase
MRTWSLATTEPVAGGQTCVAALRDESLYPIPPVADLPDVDAVLRQWSEVAPVLRDFEPTGAPLHGMRLLAPVRRPRKLICAGANYGAHLREMGIEDVPADPEPFFFLLPPTSITGPDEPVFVPPDPALRVDWEAELAIVIGSTARNVPVAHALEHVAGYTIVNDISARGAHARPNPVAPPFAFDWLRSKGGDSFCPTGPGVTPHWFVPDPQDLAIRLWRNDELEQDGRTSDMLVGVASLIAAASEIMTLEPGDLIATGTPAGVGVAQGLQLADGDRLRIEVDGLGRLENVVRTRVPATSPDPPVLSTS